MIISTLKIGRQKYVVILRKEFDRLRRKAELLSKRDAADIADSIARLNDPTEERIPWTQVKKRARLK